MLPLNILNFQADFVTLKLGTLFVYLSPLSLLLRRTWKGQRRSLYSMNSVKRMSGSDRSDWRRLGKFQWVKFMLTIHSLWGRTLFPGWHFLSFSFLARAQGHEATQDESLQLKVCWKGCTANSGVVQLTRCLTRFFLSHVLSYIVSL